MVHSILPARCSYLVGLVPGVLALAWLAGGRAGRGGWKGRGFVGAAHAARSRPIQAGQWQGSGRAGAWTRVASGCLVLVWAAGQRQQSARSQQVGRSSPRSSPLALTGSTPLAPF